MKTQIISPLVTEKNTIHNATGVYVFEVAMKATKGEIKAEVEKNFSVKVAGGRTTVCRGRSKTTQFGRTQGPYWKKAFVQWKEGEKIALVHGG
ncbi:MAG: 50S ribosomal protein L23 [Pseudobdellovibrionaceae bacterium]